MKVLPSRAHDIQQILSDGLRDQDVAELAALGRSAPESLQTGLDSGGALCFTIHVDGVAAGMFGAVSAGVVDLGVVWLLGSNRLYGAAREFLREAPEWLDMLNLVYPTLTNIVDDRNTASVGWLKRMGVDFLPEPIPIADTTFRRFTRCASPYPSLPPSAPR